MKHQNISYLTVGVFVLAMLVGLVAMLAWITGRTGPTDAYHVHYDSVAGIASGTPVTYEGYTVGRVAGIEPRRSGGETRYRVDLEVRRGWPIPADSLARVVSSGLLSAITIDIREGEAERLLEPGSEIEGREGASLFEAVDAIAGDVNDITQDGLMPLIENLNRRIDRVASSFEREAPEILAHLRRSAATLDAGLETTLADTRTLVERLNESAEGLRQATGTENREALAGFLKGMEQSARTLAGLAESLEDSRGRLDRVLDESHGILSGSRGDLEEAADDLRASLQRVSEHVGSISYNLDVTSRNMAEFSRQIRQNPGSLLGTGAPPARAR